MQRQKVFGCYIKYILLFALILSPMGLFSQTASKQKKINIQGVIFEKGVNTPLPGATVRLPQYGIGTVTDLDGKFTLKGVPIGKTTIEIRFIGMVTIQNEITINDKLPKTNNYYLEAENFGLKEVTVVAKNNKVGASTASSISRSAMDHLQATNLGAVLELLPGQLASNPTMNSPVKATIRQASPSNDLNSMGTSIVFNGAPVSNNANMQIGNTAKSGTLNTEFSSTAGSGIDLRQISADNIESVDVIRGIPSVEYGDLTSGVIIVNPKAGVYPFQVRLKINPTLTQASIGKGFGLGENGGKLSVDVDYAKSLSDERRPYQGFQRITGNLLYSKTFAGAVSSTTGLGFYSDLDAMKLDPSDKRYQRERRAEDTGIKFNTNIVWNAERSFFKFLKFNFSVNYAKQKGYNQELKSDFGYMVTSAMQDGTITSNRKSIIKDANGEGITNAPDVEPSALTNILPYEFLTKIWTYGKPLNLFGKLSANFFGEVWSVKNRVVVGTEWKTDKNFGQGKVFDPLNPPSRGLRMRPYNDIPALNQFSFYAEDNLEKTILNRSLKIQLGVRMDMIQPGKDICNTVVSPRVNASYEIVPDVLTIRGGWGITAKAPPIMYLYPDMAYYDFVNFDNIGSAKSEVDKLSILTTKVYDTTNKDLKIAKNAKSEIGFDLQLGKASLMVVGYNEKLRNGYSFGADFSAYQLFNLIKYKGTPRDGTYPALEVEKEQNVVLSYNKPLNGKENVNKGIEFDLSTGLIEPIRTEFVFNGALMESKIYSTLPLFYQKNQDTDGNYKDIGVYAAGDGSQYNRFSTTLRVIHNIPKIGFVVSLAIQTIWKDEHRYLGTENKIPVGYMDAKTLAYTALPTGSTIHADWQKPILLSNEITDYYSPMWLFNLRLTKEIKKYGGFAFFVNNVFMHRPQEESKRTPGQYTYRNPEQFFGAELWFKF